MVMTHEVWIPIVSSFLIVTALTMFIYIKTFFLNALVATDAVSIFDDVEEGG